MPKIQNQIKSMPLSTMYRLHYAARSGRLERITELESTCVNLKDSIGNTPLHYAARGGYLDVVRQLIRNGADVNSVSSGCFKRTPLHEALCAGRTADVVLLLRSGADVQHWYDHGKDFCYGLDCYMNNAILERGEDVNTHNMFGYTSIHSIRRSRANNKIVFHLLECGANVELKNYKGRDALLMACSIGSDYSVIHAILQHGADVDSRDDEGSGPMWLVMNNKCYWKAKVLDLLVDRGADVFQFSSTPGFPTHKIFLLNDCPLLKVDISYDAITALLDYGIGDLRCCGKTSLQCILGKYFPTTTNSTEVPPRVEYAKQHYIKTSIAQIHHPPVPVNYKNWLSDNDIFPANCKRELNSMKHVKVKGTNVSYYKLFYKEKSAYDSLKASNLTLTLGDLPECLRLFPIYGRLLFFRYKTFSRKLVCYKFFSSTRLPALPMECVDEIVSYLKHRDVVNLDECINQLGL